MKKLLIFLSMLAGSIIRMAASYDVEIDGIYYNLGFISAEVTYGEKKYQDKEISIPSHITFDGDSYVVTTIGEDAFRGCNRLQKITLPYTLSKLGKGCFAECLRLESITIPSEVGTIGEEAFKSSSLKHVVFEDGCKNCHYIGKYAFSRTQIESITLPANLSTVEEGAFKFCSSLTNVVFPDDFGWIETEAFSYCGLKEITLPTGIQSLKLRAFNGCPLETINVLAAKPPFTRSPDGTRWGFPFDNATYENAIVYVPTEYLDTYLNTAYWGKDTSGFGYTYPWFRNIRPKDFTAIEDVIEDGVVSWTVYDLNGVMVSKDCPVGELRQLKSGIYILQSGSVIKKIMIP